MQAYEYNPLILRPCVCFVQKHHKNVVLYNYVSFENTQFR
jgi:hypothetical protein